MAKKKEFVILLVESIQVKSHLFTYNFYCISHDKSYRNTVSINGIDIQTKIDSSESKLILSFWFIICFSFVSIFCLLDQSMLLVFERKIFLPNLFYRQIGSSVATVSNVVYQVYTKSDIDADCEFL